MSTSTPITERHICLRILILCMSPNVEQTVLFVDDEPEEADFYAEYFDRHADIVPVTTLSADDALTILQEKEIDCLVSDSVHTTEGEPLVKVAKQRYPTLSVLLYSGRTPENLPTDVVDDYLRKGTATDAATILGTLAERIRNLKAQTSLPQTPLGRPSGQEWQYLGTFDWSDSKDTSSRVLNELADQTEFDPLESSPLFETINPDAIDQLFKHASADGTETDVVLQFSFAGYTIRLFSHGTVEYRDATQTESAQYHDADV